MEIIYDEKTDSWNCISSLGASSFKDKKTAVKSFKVIAEMQFKILVNDWIDSVLSKDRDLLNKKEEKLLRVYEEFNISFWPLKTSKIFRQDIKYFIKDAKIFAEKDLKVILNKIDNSYKESSYLNDILILIKSIYDKVREEDILNLIKELNLLVKKRKDYTEIA